VVVLVVLVVIRKGLWVPFGFKEGNYHYHFHFPLMKTGPHQAQLADKAA